MANSTSFGWELPDDTDLVKDGAAAMRTLGNAIDASMTELRGGTTGQVLSKTSNTDMDFTWVAQDDSNAIQNAIVDAKGDLIAASANDTPARLAVGANGETLVADSSTSTGLRYQAPVQQNPVLNSAFQVWQRGTSFTGGTTTYGADRWLAYRNTTGSTFSRQATGDTTNLPNIQYCLRAQRNSGTTATNSLDTTQIFESVNTIPYAGKTVTLSFYARAGSNYSAASNLFYSQVFTGTGTDQNFYSGYTGQVTASNQSFTLTTTWQRFSATFTIAATATEMSMLFVAVPTGTAGANDFYELTGVQLEVGSVATPFKTYAATIQGELAACQRYYFRAGGDNVYQYLSAGLAASSTDSRFGFQPPVTMRTAPSSLEYSTLATYDVGAASIIAVTNLTVANGSKNMTSLTATVASGLTTYRPLYLITNNSTSGYVALNAEL
jgi:hypothetical protein